MILFKKHKTQDLWVALLVGFLALSLSSCDFLDPTGVRNPQTTEESLRAGGTGATTPFLNGIVFRYSDATEDIAYFTDVVSDNYDNVATFISPNADFPRAIVPQDLTLNAGDGPYFEVQELRALATFALETVIPNDAQATAQQRAEVLFYRGMANLLSGENYGGVPIQEDGPVISPNELIQMAIADFDAALATSQHADFPTRINIVRARAYRMLGNAAQAAQEANAALAGNPQFTFAARYDASFNVNDGYTFAVSRNLNDIQPLPRLDFLDPKYTLRDSPINSIKMEEAHLILAEVALSQGSFGQAKTHMINAINLANSRPVVQFRDVDPRPDNQTGTFRPQGGTVQASPTSPPIDGLILPRAGNTVPVPTISATHLTPDDINAIPDSNPVELLRTLYLLRQEIFFFEGRRMSDLGIRLPMMEREIETNPNISAGGPGTVAVVAAYIPQADGLDEFTFDGSNTVIAVDMNQVIADNRISPFTMPF
jgi:tetratricopeptide (TPR) repeat protein